MTTKTDSLMDFLDAEIAQLKSEGRFVKLRVSAKGMRIIDKLGIDSVIADMRARGVRV